MISVEEQSACVVRDHAYVYFEDEAGRRSSANLLTRNGAANIAKLPKLLRKAGP